LGVVVAAPFVLAGMGFGAAGVTAGSLAASAQGATVAAGGWFAVLQSAAMSGVGLGTTAAVTSTGSVAGAVMQPFCDKLIAMGFC
jgi:hypothetical protein